MDDPLDAGLAPGQQDVERADHVGLDDLGRVDVGVGDGDQGAEVQDGADPLHGGLDGGQVAQVAGDDLELGEGLGRQQA